MNFRFAFECVHHVFAATTEEVLEIEMHCLKNSLMQTLFRIDLDV